MRQSESIKKQVEKIAEIITQLEQQKTELVFRIEELKQVKQELTRQLTPDDRIERLFN